MKFLLNLVLTFFFNIKKEFLRKELIAILVLSIIIFSPQFIYSQKADSLLNPKEHIIVVGSEIDYPPYCMLDEQGKPEGFSVDLFKAVAKEMNLNIKFKTGIWSDLKNDLKEGTIDALPLVGRAAEREEIFDFTFPYLTMHGCILIKDDVTNISSLDDLINKKVAVLKGDNSEEFLNRIKFNAEIFPTNTYYDAVKALSDNKYDAVIIQKMVALRIIKELQITNLKIISDPIYEFKQEFCFAVTKNNSELLSKLNEGLSIVRNNGVFDELYKKWFFAYETEKFKKLTIIVGGDDSYPPYEFIDENGEAAGYNVELTKAIAKEIGLIVDIKLGPWSEVKYDLDNGIVDIVQGMFYSDERSKTYTMSQAHTMVGHVLISRIALPNTFDLSSLKDSSIIVQSSDIMHEFLIENEFRNISTVNSQEEALKLVSEGRINYALVDRLPALYWIDKNKWDNLIISEQAILSPEYCYATLTENEKLVEMFTEGLKAIKETGEYRKISSKWFGVYDKNRYDKEKILKYSILILLFFLILIIVIFIWSNTLRRQVRKRTEELNNQNTKLEMEILVRKKTELKLEGSESKLRDIVESSTNMFYKHDPNHTLSYISPQSADILGYECEDLKVEWTELTTDNPINEVGYHSTIRAIETGIAQPTYELELFHKSKKKVMVEVREAPLVVNGKIIAIVGSLTDITERKRAEKDLIIAKEKAEESDRLKSAFLSNMSHEIRTPMNGILGFISLLNQPDLQKTQIDKYSAIINKSGSRLLNTINDIIDISKIEAGEMLVTVKETSITNMMDELYSFHSPEANLKGLSLHLEPLENVEEINIITDSDKLHGILTNLIKNAIKYAERGNITFGYVLKENLIEFFVNDTGIGIPEHRLKGIFNRFEQADIEDKSAFEGSGLGLAIAKAYVEMLGGEIFVESVEEKGSKFMFTLPHIKNTIEEAEQITQLNDNNSSKIKNLNILIVEDDDVSSIFLEAILQDYAREITFATNGIEAIELCKSDPNLDLVLMDVKMPIMDGYSTTQEIRKFNKDLIIISQTAYALAGDNKKALEAGCNDYITKPINKKELIEKIERFFN